MVFFNTKQNENGLVSLVVSQQLWWFFAVAVPLTAVVFILWMQLRNKLTTRQN